MGIPNDQLADYVNAGLAAEVPADLYADEDFADAAIQACYVSGVRYAAPLSVETTALFYQYRSGRSGTGNVGRTGCRCGRRLAEFSSMLPAFTMISVCTGVRRLYFKYENGSYDVTDIGLANEGAVQAYEFINALCNEYGLVSADVTADPCQK